MSASERAQSSADQPGPDPSHPQEARATAEPAPRTGDDAGDGAEGESPAPDPGPSRDPVPPREAILRVVRDVIAPLVHADGGDLHVVSADDAGIALHLSGRYSGCPGNTLARRRVIEPLIAKAAPGATVTVTSGPLIPAVAEPVEPVP
jgi:Fe-S cluster biogenesis protein NfuA